MRRRDFVAGLGCVAAWPLAARAQRRAHPTIGYLGSVSPDENSPPLRGGVPSRG
jgi:putative ABC transport system substrate-binding protein